MKRVLVVEDHATFRKALVLVLQRLPEIGVIEQAGSLAGCREIIAAGERFDLAVVDLMLPDGNGVKVVGELRAGDPGTSILVLTASTEKDPAREAGATEVLDKETPFTEIVAVIRRLAGGNGRGRAPLRAT